MNTQKTITGLALIFLAVLVLPMMSALVISNVQANPDEVAPGDTIRVSLEIENELGKDTESIIVSLQLGGLIDPTSGMVISEPAPFAPYGSSTDEVIEELDDGDEETVTFNLIALSDAEAGTYKIPVVINYEVAGVPQTPKTSFIGITVNAEAELDVNYEGELIKGQKREIDVRVTNTGLTGVKFLSIGVREVEGITIVGMKNIYIGDIESDDFDSADFKIYTKSKAGETINLPVTLTYRDATNKPQTETVILELTTYSKDEAIKLGLIQPNYTPYYLGGILVLIVLWVVYRKIKKRRRNKKNRGK